MRKRYFTSHNKLPVILILIIASSFALANETQKEDEEEQVSETNIVCFAANNKWICAPEDQQNIASEKALKSLEARKTEVGSTEVVIKPINIPKFNTNQPYNPSSTQSKSSANQPKTNTQRGITREDESSELQGDSNIKIKESPANNPYAKLWSHQLIGLSSYQSAIRFVKEKQLNKNDVLILKSVRAGKEWWIVLFGLYKDKQTGLDNAYQLPVNLNKPWLRPLKGLVINGFIEKY